MADKKISELDLALLINDDAEFPFSQDNAGEPTTFKGRITQLGTKIAEDMTFSNLRTTSKKLVGAINELLSLGSPIIIGTSAPTSSIGADGNIYVQYTAGTGGADDEVDGIYVKIDGAWCEISTGGGGTTDYEDLSNKPKVNSVELVGNKSLDDLGIMPASLSKTASGSIASFTDGADNIPVKSLVSEIVAVESGSGEKSPTNPYTISGFDNGVVSVSGINLWDEQWELGTLNWANGSPEPSTSYFRSKNYILCKPNTTYRAVVGSGITLYAYDKDKVCTRRVINTQSDLNFTTQANEYYLRFLTALEETTYQNNISINYPSTDIQYHAYNGNTYTFAFGQTVYGGHFDNKGNLVVTYAQTDINSAINNRTTSYDNPVFYGSISGLKPQSNNSLCECFNTINGQASTQLFAQNSNNHDFAINSLNSGDTIQAFIRADEYSDVASLKSACGSSKIKFELATPITLSITSQDIPTLLGENNIFSNCGDVEVEYYTDKADEIVEVAKATASTPLHNYSTDEQVVGTWIDGSTIYEKTINVGTITANTTVAHGIDNLDTIIDYSGFGKYAGTDKTVMPFQNPASGFGFGINTYDGTNLVVAKSSSLGSDMSDCYMTLRYTKTTSNTRNLNLSKGVEETELADETEEQEEQER